MDNLTTLSIEAKQFHNQALLRRAKKAQIFYELGKKDSIPLRKGNSIGWRRFNALTPTTTAITEGITPAATPISMTEVTATLAQYGAYVEVTDMLDMTGIDPVIAEATQFMGQHAGESIELVISAIVGAGTSVMYGISTTRNAQSSSNPLTFAMIRKAVRTLDVNNALRYQGMEENKKVGQGEYVLVVHPRHVYDLKNDAEWKTHQQQSPGYEKLYNGELFMVEGCRVVQSTLCPVFTGEGAAGADVYGAILFAQEAFGCVDTNGSGKFEVIAKQRGTSGVADPLDQRGTVGWKSQHVSKILNDNFMVRIETGVSA